MAKDWITGRSWARGSSSSPFAMAALGFLQAMQQNQRRDEDKAEQERMMQQREAMAKIQQSRTLMEKMAQLDPALWGDQGFVTAWNAGDNTYLAKSGWKPPVSTQKPEFIDKEIGGNIVRLDPITGEYKPVYQAPAKETPDKPVTLGEGGVLIDPKTGKVIYKNPKTYKPGSPDGGGSGDPKPTKTRWGKKQVIWTDGKVHIVQYDMDAPNDQNKWYDLGIAGGVALNNPPKPEKLSITEKYGVDDGTDEEDEVDEDDEDAVFIRGISELLKKS
jgi:hypothetical protein